jgi:hypothetical protein
LTGDPHSTQQGIIFTIRKCKKIQNSTINNMIWSRFARTNVLRSSLKSYNVIDHSFDAVVVGAGGSGNLF